MSSLAIPQRPSMAFFALFAAAMVIGSYVFVLALAAACVYFPYFFLSNSDSYNVQVILLFLFGIVIAATMVWSLLPRLDKFEAPGMLLDATTIPNCSLNSNALQPL